MGVHGLWDLLAPVGHRVSVETLAGRRLAIDASIWMIQFMKAMRDDKGEMIRNAHLVGFFRRICKLLFLRTKPVFVFDGGTPALKRRTVIARRRQRENAQAKIRKIAEKLLLNQLKATRLKELAESVKNQRSAKVAKCKETATMDQPDSLGNNDTSRSSNVEKMDELLAASLAAEDCDGCYGSVPVPGYGTGNFDGSSSMSGAANKDEDEDDEDEDDEELILPMGNGGVDPAVLAALPPSIQLDLLVQMRERLMAENRQKYQRIKKAPQKFSELQIESYLKTVAFRREIDGVQRAAAGRGMDGLQTSRIASEANREFIFSTSFTGDKQELASSGVVKTDKRLDQSSQELSTFELLSRQAYATKSNPEVPSAADEPDAGEPDTGINDDVQTYLDERGHVRMSRVRAMGIRMTRDLQRNLDLMRELEQEALTTYETENVQVDLHEKVLGGLGNSDQQVQLLQTEENCLQDDNDDRGTNSMSAVGGHTPTPAKNGNPIEISFEDNEEQKSSEDMDDLFADLVAGSPIVFSTTGSCPLITHASDPNSDCEWEEGIIGVDADSLTNEHGKEVDALEVDGSTDSAVEFDWEEGAPASHNDVHLSPSVSERPLSKGSLEEEIALQEAIRRSLEDVSDEMSFNVSSESGNIEEVFKLSSRELLRPENDIAGPGFEIVNNVQAIRTPSLLDGESDKSSPSTNVGVGISGQSTSTVVCTSHGGNGAMDSLKTFGSPDNQKRTEDVASSSVLKEILETKSVDPADANPNENCSHATPICPTTKASDTHHEGRFTDEIYLDLVQDQKHNSKTFAAEHSKKDNIKFHGTSLEDELQDLSREYMSLGEEQRKLERNVDSVNSEMFVECQELLQMFGLPYIIAPMEAEAQCAFMEHAKLVDGVVTDDSDVFLFGARSVYKNIFDDRKYVETYLMKDIENELGLDQEKLIHMALLLGSDYTEGISGIGIVNAVEVINAFPEEDGLQKFREWIESPDPMILGKSGIRSKSKASEPGSNCSEASTGDYNDMLGTKDSQKIDSNIQHLKQIFMDKHRNVSKNWHVPSSFPSEAVFSAYKSPQVDKSTDPFSWGKPDLFSLRRLCWEKFGWGSQKADELLLPVLKEYNKHETQLRLEAFYTFNERFAKIRSKRIKKAVKGITKNQSTELTTEVDTAQGASDSIQKRTIRSSSPRNKRKKPTDDDSGFAGHAAEHVSRPRKRKARGVGAGRGKAKISGNPSAGGSGRRKRISGSDAETSCSDVDCIDGLEHAMHAGKEEGPSSLRKSMRSRKAANYAESDVEIDELECLNKNEANPSRIGTVEEHLSQDHGIGTGDAADSSPVQLHIGEESMATEGLSEDYLLKGGGFCANEDEVEADEAQRSHLQYTGTPFDADAYHLHASGSFADEGDTTWKEHRYDDTSRTLTEVPGTVNPSICFPEPKMGEDNSIEGKLIKPSGGSLVVVHEHINEDQNDERFIQNDKPSKGGNVVLENSKNDDQTGVKPSKTTPYLRRSKRTRSSR